MEKGGYNIRYGDVIAVAPGVDNVDKCQKLCLEYDGVKHVDKCHFWAYSMRACAIFKSTATPTACQYDDCLRGPRVCQGKTRLGTSLKIPNLEFPEPQKNQTLKLPHELDFKPPNQGCC